MLFLLNLSYVLKTEILENEIPLKGDEKSTKADLKIFSFEGDMFPTAIGLKLNRYELGIHSCAYFKNPNKATLVINVFTDALWRLLTILMGIILSLAKSISVIKGIK